MKTLTFITKEEWLTARRGRISGTAFKDILVKRGTGRKIGFYQLVADKLGIPADGEDPMARGNRLQPIAIAEFEKQTGKKVSQDLCLWVRDDNENIAISPDGVISETEAVEVKALGSARHLEAIIENKIPDEYELQAIQYFIVNDKLQKLYFILYDDRVLAKPYYVITVDRKDVQEKVDEYLSYQKNVLAEVNELVAKLSNF